MARVWTDGFELGGLRGYFLNGGGIGTSSAESYGGSRSLQFTTASRYARLTLPAALVEGYARLACRYSSSQDGFRFYASSAEVFRVVRNTSTGYIEIRDGSNNVLDTGGTLTNNDIWYVVEVHWVIGETGTIEVKVDGEIDSSYSGDTRFGAAASVDEVRLSSLGYFDDFAINDTTGSVDNSWCGAGKVYYMPAASDTSTQWTPSAGSDNYAMVDEAPHDSDTTYVQTATNGHTDVYGLGTPPAAMEGKIIKRAWPEAVCRKTESEEGLGISLGITIGTTTDNGDQIAPGVEYNSARIIGDEHVINPDTTEAWNFSELDDIKVRLNAHVAAE